MTVTYNDATYTYDDTGLTYDGTLPQFDGATITVQAAFGEAPLTVDPSWQDVTEWVRDITIARGRQSEYTTFGVGTATITLDNRDRRFDPTYTSSPYYGDLNPMVPIRVEANYDGDTWTLFYGFAQGWPTSYSMPNVDAVARVTAVDGSRLLSNLLLDDSAFAYEVMKDGAYWYFPLQSLYQEDGFTLCEDYAGRTKTHASRRDLVPTVYDAGLPVGASQASNTYNAWRWYPTGPATSAPSTGDTPDVHTFEFWFDSRIDLTNSETFDAYLFRNETGRRIDMRIQGRWTGASGSAQWEFYSIVYGSEQEGLALSTGTLYPFTPNVGMNHVVMTVNGTTVDIYVNAVLLVSLTAPTGSFSVSSSQFAATVGQSSPPGISNIVVYENGLSASQVLTHYNAGLGYTPELSSARLTRVLDEVSWPSAWRDIDTGVQLVGAYRPDGLDASRYWEQIANAEQGEIFINRDGHVQMLSRTTTGTVNIKGLFDDTETDAPFSGLQVDANSIDTIRNNVIVNYANGSTTSTDATSVATYGQATQRLDARLIADATDAQSIGDTQLARAKDPRTRITQLNVNVRSDIVTALPVVAPLDIGEDVAVVFTPTGVGDPLWRAVTVEGIRHTITGESWETQLYLSPSAINTNGALLVLDDDTYGKLDDGNKLG